MSMQRYRLLFNPIFEKDLDEITDYISIHLQNPEAALRLVDDLENAIYRRLGTPLAFAPYPPSKARPTLTIE
jgi:toxin ParE1/3/4